MAKSHLSTLNFQPFVRMFGITLSVALAFSALPPRAAAQQPVDAYPRLNFGAKAGKKTGGSSVEKDAEKITGTATDDSDASSAYERRKVVKKKKKKTSANNRSKSSPDANLSSKAATELTLEADEKSLNELPTPATVTSSVAPVLDPVARSSFELGLSYENFQPAGRIKLSGIDAYTLDTLAPRPMLAVELRWFPWKVPIVTPIAVGLFGVAGYSQHQVNITTAVGTRLGDTELHSLRTQVGPTVSWQWRQDSRWDLRTEFGIGTFSSIQSSSSALANHSAGETFTSIGGFLDVRVWERVAIFAGYEQRSPLHGEPDEIVLQRSSVLAGIAGGFQ